ncbi:MAG: RNase adapter RapZ [Acidobacteria bacterium]|nr:MAG: RNase adapter RapZ [Acidobacteriota bacterium]
MVVQERVTLKTVSELKSLVVITGMSGSGKRTIYKAFEDIGYFCVDNLPTALIPRLLEMSALSGGKISELAIVVDARLGESVSGFKPLFESLKQAPYRTTIIFVDASDDVLARRYSETRRVHPLAQNRSLTEGIRAERRKLSEIRAMADLVIDTSDLNVHDLRRQIYEDFRHSEAGDHLLVTIISFGFKHGIPYNSDLVFDVRFLPNPNFVPELKSLSGNDPEVCRYMSNCSETHEILAKITDMLEYLLPRYSREGKSYLTIGIGCTGGRHRSVMLANELKKQLASENRRINVIHRDLNLR